MKIAFFTINIDQIGGIESVITSLSNYFINKLNYQVDVISLFGKEKDIMNRKLTEKVNRIYLNMDYLEEKDRFSQLINSYKYGKQLKEYLGNIQYDFIIGTHFNTNMICILNKKDIKGKIIGSEHSEYYQAGRLTRLIRALYYRKLDKFIVLTNEQKELYGRYLKNVKVINNPISFKSNEISNCENKRIITAGRLSHEKGFDRIIDIFSVISKKYSDWVLDIFGEGQQKELLQKKIKDYNLEDKIRILPFTNDIKQEFLKSGIYVLPSRNEAFSLVLLEAMECGLPSVSFDTSGPKEIITNNVDGIIIKNDDLNKFIEELEQVIMDIDIRKKYGREAKKQVKRFYIENIAKEWNGLFEEVLF